MKTRSGRCDDDKGPSEKKEKMKKIGESTHLLMLHTRSQAARGQLTCLATSGSSQHKKHRTTREE